MQRRDFLKMIGATTAIVVAAPASLFSNTPMLWGDGIHCDASAIEAFGSGLPVLDPRGFIQGNKLIGGVFSVDRPIQLKPTRDLEFHDNVFEGESIFAIDDTEEHRILFNNGEFRARGYAIRKGSDAEFEQSFNGCSMESTLC